MQRVSNGFTIVEVMIFLAVSSALMASAWGLIAGRQEQVMFDQKMRDTQSKFQQWLSDVSNGSTNGDLSKQWCLTSASNLPEIVDPTNPLTFKPSGYSPQCIFLGKAIQFSVNSGAYSNQASTLYAYSVFGCRLDNNCSTNGSLPQDMKSANPEPAIGGSATIGSTTYTFADLTETFDLSPAYVSSVSGINQLNTTSTTHMIGFMNSFNYDSNTKANGSEDLKIFLYDLNGNNYLRAATSGNGKHVTDCLENNGSCNYPSDPPLLKSYQFCLSDGNHTAQITISSASGIGATTKLDYIVC